jgi:hypothetical protein
MHTCTYPWRQVLARAELPQGVARCSWGAGAHHKTGMVALEARLDAAASAVEMPVQGESTCTENCVCMGQRGTRLALRMEPADMFVCVCVCVCVCVAWSLPWHEIT